MPTEPNTTAEEPTAEEEVMDSISLAELLTSETPPEAEPVTEEEEVEADPAEEQEAEQEEEAAETEPEQPKPETTGMQKRIDKLTAQKSELNDKLLSQEQRLAELENRLQAKPDPKPDAFEARIREVTSISELERLEQESRDVELWARKQQKVFQRDPDKASEAIQKKFGDVTDPEQFLEDLELSAAEARSALLPSAKKRVELTQQWDQQAQVIYPWMADSSSPGQAVIGDVLKKFGDKRLSEIPMVKLMLARMVVGAHQEKVAANKQVTPKPKPQPTPQPGKPVGAKPKPSNNKDKADAAAKRIRSGGGRAALADLVMASMEES